MGRILIASYSMTGTTERAAEDLAGRVHAEREIVHTLREREGLARYLWALWGALAGREPLIGATMRDPARYALTVLATPVWAARMSSPMRSYIVERRGRFSRVAFLCTQNGSGAERVFEAMSALSGQRPVATLALSAHDFREGMEERLADFARVLEGALPHEAPARKPGRRLRSSHRSLAV